MTEQALRLKVGDRVGEVSALLLAPRDARGLLVFGHGAGAGMRHSFMQAMADRLATRGLATFRYQFPYMEKGGRRPDPPGVLTATVREAFAAAAAAAPGLPLLAGGKSMGGRLTSVAAAKGELPGLCGLVFFGFPLHPAGRPSTDRAAHLPDVPAPMLFLQGTHDSLADLGLLRPICERLAAPAHLHVIDGADHGFHVLKSSGRTEAEVLDELAEVAVAWADRLANDS